SSAVDTASSALTGRVSLRRSMSGPYSEASCEESPPSLAPPPSLPPLSLPPLSLPPLSLCSTARVLPSSSPVSPPHPARAGTSTAPAAISAADRRRPRACTMGTSSDQRQAHT